MDLLVTKPNRIPLGVILNWLEKFPKIDFVSGRNILTLAVGPLPTDISPSIQPLDGSNRLQETAKEPAPEQERIRIVSDKGEFVITEHLPTCSILSV